MAEHKPLYKWSLKEAINLGEEDKWRNSYKENCVCARAIEKAITDNYNNNILNTDAAKDIIAEFGYDRVNHVLADTIQQHSEDGRFSQENKDWANNFYIPNDDINWHFAVEEHPGLVNIFVDRVRKEFQTLGLYDKTHCNDEGNYEDKVLVLKPSTLKDEYKTPDFQLFLATSGFGCYPDRIGTSITGVFIKDDERATFRRQDFIGCLKEDLIPEWAQEKLKEYDEPEESSGIKMEGV